MVIDNLIKLALLEKNGSKLEAYRAIKSEILLNNSSKKPKPEGKIIEFDNQSISELQISIIHKLIKQREESISIYEANSRYDLADGEKEQLKYLKELLPPSISDEELEKEIPSEIEKKDMGNIIKLLKEKFPTVNPKHISELVKNHLV